MIKLVNFLDETYEKQFQTLEWRNSENVSKYFQIKHIEEKTHINWLKKLNEKKPKTIAFFVCNNEEYIGVTYFHSIDYEKKEADWGIYIYQENLRGKGIGKMTLNNCLKYAKEKLKLKTIFLEVLTDNLSAVNLYEKTGFEFDAKKNDKTYRYKKHL